MYWVMTSVVVTGTSHPVVGQTVITIVVGSVTVYVLFLKVKVVGSGQ